MTYNDQLRPIVEAFEAKGIVSTKKTHAMRKSGAIGLFESGVEMSDIAKQGKGYDLHCLNVHLGQWNLGALNGSYLDLTFPIEAMLAAAHFDKDPKDYFLARDVPHHRSLKRESSLGSKKSRPSGRTARKAAAWPGNKCLRFCLGFGL